MANTKNALKDVVWVGADDRRLELFENIYPLPKGVSYNSYLILDGKTALMDTADASVADLFFENIDAALNGRPLNYVVVQHMEPDHSATLMDLIRRYPDVTVVCNAKTEGMIHQFFHEDLVFKCQIVKEGDTLPLGQHILQFTMAPMVHWPEVMMTYDQTAKILFSADAFGSFGTLDGALFADEVDFKGDYLMEARRYYANIVGKYGAPVQAVLKKAAGLDIQMICPLHGFVWRKDLSFLLDKYQHWSTYQPEEKAVVVAYASMYGHTAKAAETIAETLVKKGCPVCVYDLSKTDRSVVLSEVFRVSHLVLAATTHDGELFEPMEYLLREMKSHGVQGRKVALIENGSWASVAAKKMQELLETMKDMQVVSPVISIKSALAPSQETELTELANALVQEN
ncbi:MAG: FprA family A-type flavoprotein [Alphaproteobacteria bacterium]|nr:FprA family A-type flavoprotein [Alphaproteobacteria bacterium]